jgi:membrane fusion protein
MSTPQHGEVVLITELSLKIIASMAVLIAFTLVVIFVSFTYQRKVQVTGVLSPEAGFKRIVSPQAGTILRANVKEGQHVQAGDLLFVVSSTVVSTTSGDTGQAISASIESSRRSLQLSAEQQIIQGRQREEALKNKISSLAQQRSKDNAQIGLQQTNIDLVQADFKRQSDLLAQGFVSAAAIELKRGEVLRQQQQMLSLESDRITHERELLQAEADLKEQRASLELALASTDRDLAALDQRLVENEGRREIVIKAPQDGVISTINIEQNQMAEANQGLAVLIPKNSLLLAELYAPSRSAGFVKVGMDVLVDYPAFPYQKFGHQKGHVVEVSNSAMRPEEMLIPGATQAAAGETVYRIRVALESQEVTTYGEKKPLKSGMAVEARVVLDERTLAEWALEPLMTVNGRL